MKKMMILLCGLVLLGTTVAHADNDKPITFEQLPQQSQQFIKKHFPDEKVSFAKLERDFLETRYEVLFVSSTKVEFLKNGEWKEVDCRYSTVPAGIVPAQIAAKVKELYPEALVTEINRDSREYEVKLNNGLEMTFNLKFELVGIDD